MEWPPQPRSASRRATPPASSGAVPSSVVPDRNVTVPVGVPGASACTVASRVTIAPKAAKAAEETIVNVVGARPTVWRRIAELGAKLPSPGYSTVISSSPTGRSAILSRACPTSSNGAVPTQRSPARDVTVPVGTRFVAGEIGAVQVVGQPKPGVGAAD